MNALRFAISSVLVLALAGCGSDSEVAMPDITGTRLDVALSDIERAGFDGEPEVTGGGVFGILDKSNWTVCEQSPAAGEAMSGKPRLTVDRSCKGADVTKTPSASPSATATGPSSTPSPSRGTAEPTAKSTLTAKSSADLAALLAITDYCDESVAAFADKYQGQIIEFDGSIAAMNNHEDYKTRYDILLAPGDKGPDEPHGPAFQFQDVGIVDLHLTGDNVPDTIGPGDLLHIVAEVGSYDANHGCLFELDPVSTGVR